MGPPLILNGIYKKFDRSPISPSSYLLICFLYKIFFLERNILSKGLFDFKENNILDVALSTRLLIITCLDFGL